MVCLVAGSAPCAQLPTAFEVASIRQGNADQRGNCGEFLPGGNYRVVDCPLIYIIEKLYRLREFQTANAPKWITEGSTSTFTIEAKSRQPASNDQLRLMAENLLADRFRLVVHKEMRPLSVYALIAGKNGMKLHPARDEGTPRGIGPINIFGPGWLGGKNVSLAHLVDLLSGRVDRPVIDKTNFAWPYRFQPAMDP